MSVGEVWAARSSSGLTSVGLDSTGSPSPLKDLSAATFTLPQELGIIQESAEVPSSGKTVIHIQDAHCNYAAQKSIAEILNYLTTEYGIYAVNCEGGAENYDLSPFTTIPEKDIREKTTDFFVKEGVVSAAEYYAVNNPQKVNLWGVEDPDLYLKNLKVYRDSLAHKDEVDRYIKSIGHILDNLKRHIYSNELLELDKYYTGYKDGKIIFKEYILYLINMARKRVIDIKSFSNMYLLSQTLADEDKISFKRANNEKDEVVDKLKKSLSRNELEELMVMVSKLKAERISQADFYAYLVKKAKSVKLDISGYPELQKYIVYISLYSAIDRTKVTREIDTLEDRIKTSLYENDSQRELGILSKNLAITKNMFNISLTRDDYIYYKEHRETFAVANYISFIDKKAPLYKISAALDKNIGLLDEYRGLMDQFYECSLERDKAFIKNIKFTDHDRPNSIIITGGFHTENLRELFKNEKVSYISIMPKFKNEKGYESPYMKRLAGQRTALENVIDTAIPAILNLATVNMLSTKIAARVEGQSGLKRFRLAIVIVAAVIRGEQFILRIQSKFIDRDKRKGDDDKVITFGRGEGAEIVSCINEVFISPANYAATKANAEIIGDNFAFRIIEQPATATAQAPIAYAGLPGGRIITPLPGGQPGGSLIGKLLDRNGNVITGGFIYVTSPDGKTVEISHPDMEGNITVNISGVAVPKDKIVEAIKSLAESLESNTAFTKAEKDAISSALKGIKGAVNIIAIKSMENVKGFYFDNTLFLSEDIINHPLSLIHEMGEGSENILRNILIKAGLLDVQVPGLLEMTYAQALNAHTLWRGVGEDVRSAYKILEKENVAIRSYSAKDLIMAIENKMRERGFEMSEVRKARIAKELSPLTESERALFEYNLIAQPKRKGEQLLYGLQDNIDYSGNIQFTQTLKALTGDLRQGVFNVFLIKATPETIAAQTPIGRGTSNIFEKKFGQNTVVLYYINSEELKNRLVHMQQLIGENKEKYPMAFVNCMNKKDFDIVDSLLKENTVLRDMVVPGRDFEEKEDNTNLPDEVKVLIVGSAIMNDRRLSKTFGMKPADLYQSRKEILRGLVSNNIITIDNINKVLSEKKREEIKITSIDDLTEEQADLIEDIMNMIWDGSLILRCSKINWKSFDDWKNAQRQLLQSV